MCTLTVKKHTFEEELNYKAEPLLLLRYKEEACLDANVFFWLNVSTTTKDLADLKKYNEALENRKDFSERAVLISNTLSDTIYEYNNLNLDIILAEQELRSHSEFYNDQIASLFSVIKIKLEKIENLKFEFSSFLSDQENLSNITIQNKSIDS